MTAGIAFRARLAEDGSIGALAEFVRARAELRGWLSAEAPPLHLPEAHVRGLDGQSAVRHGLDLEGVWVNPHFGADDLCLVFDRGSGELNIVYVEGMNPDGTPNDDEANKWNDLRLLIKFEGDEPRIVGRWAATTEPGRYWTQNPMSPLGAARIECRNLGGRTLATLAPGGLFG